MNTQEGNKLISKFLGHTITSYGLVYGESENFMFGQGVNELKYHKSWDWLMPVVEEIREKLGGVNVLLGETTQGKYAELLEHKGGEWHSVHRNGLNNYDYTDTSIEAAWYAVIEFIKWYNKEQEKEYDPFEHTPTPEESPYLYKRDERYV